MSIPQRKSLAHSEIGAGHSSLSMSKQMRSAHSPRSSERAGTGSRVARRRRLNRARAAVFCRFARLRECRVYCVDQGLSPRALNLAVGRGNEALN
jgi:hypothetical protein